MAATITVDEVKDGFETTISDTEIQLMIDFVDANADECLDKNSVPESTCKLLKLYAVRHMCTLMVESGRGTIKSQGAPSGASRSFNAWSGEGVTSTTYGSMLSQMDENGCVTDIFRNDNNYDLLTIGEDNDCTPRGGC